MHATYSKVNIMKCQMAMYKLLNYIWALNVKFCNYKLYKIIGHFQNKNLYKVKINELVIIINTYKV